MLLQRGGANTAGYYGHHCRSNADEMDAGMPTMTGGPSQMQDEMRRKEREVCTLTVHHQLQLVYVCSAGQYLKIMILEEC